ncbi:hypothetical protein BH20ACI3_BH20ACI3_17840 [soil metagenome]
MLHARRLWSAFFFSLSLQLIFAGCVCAQSDTIYHKIEGRIQFRIDGVGNLRVRLLRDFRPVGETFTRPEGQFNFNMLLEGDYIVETFETEKYEATSASLVVRPVVRGRTEVFRVFVELALKPPPARVAPGVLAADIDLDVPKAARKHYSAGLKALKEGNTERGIKELQTAVNLYPQYYGARLALGLELRVQKQYEKAAEVLRPLHEIAPKRAEPLVQHAAALLALGRRDEAIEELNNAVGLEGENWAAHFYLGWALLESAGDMAEPHLKRALILGEHKAARAHLALARLANAKGQQQLAIDHLEAYLKLAPHGDDAEFARRLVQTLRTSPE